MVFEIWDDKGGKPNQLVTVADEIDINSLAPVPNGEIVTFKEPITDLTPNTPYHLVVKSKNAVFSNSGKTVRLLITSSDTDTYGSAKLLDGNFGNGWRAMPPFASYIRMEMTEVDVVSNDLIVATTEDGAVTIFPDMENYPAGTEVSVTAEPEEGFEFVKWTYDGEEIVTNPASITIKSGTTLTPIFAQTATELSTLFSNIPDKCCEGLFVGNTTNIWGSNSKGILAQPFLTGPLGSLSIRMPMAREGAPGGAMVFEIWDDKGGKPNQLVTVADEIDINSLAPVPNGEIVTFKEPITDLTPNTPYHLVVKSKNAVFSNSGKTVRLLITPSDTDTYGSGKLLDRNFGNGWRAMPPFASYIRMEMTEVDVVSNDLIAVNFTWMTVGDPGNPNDPGNTSAPNTYGAVADTYRIAAHEVTNDQYAEFLNAVAVTDTNGLYNAKMGTDSKYGGITRSGVAGTFSYSVKAGFGTKPVVYTSWNDAARFTNWLHNGQPSGLQAAGTTESGAYDMSVSFPMRLPGATHFLPSENEWYKAAYYAPGSAVGGGDDYWQFPTQSDRAPNAEAPAGGANSANFSFQSGGVLTDVGAYTGTTSHYGAFDMGGNVFEWNEGVIEAEEALAVGIGGASRSLRSGSWSNRTSFGQRSSDRGFEVPTYEHSTVGFRVASLPELDETFPLRVATTEDGTVTATPNLENYPVGSEVSVTAEPEEGFEFVKWTYGDEEITTNPATITTKEGATLTPIFAKKEAEPISIDIAPAMAVSWDSQSGKIYEIQSSTDLENWVIEAEGIEGTSETSTTFFLRTTSEIYYRVAETQ